MIIPRHLPVVTRPKPTVALVTKPAVAVSVSKSPNRWGRKTPIDLKLPRPMNVPKKRENKVIQRHGLGGAADGSSGMVVIWLRDPFSDATY